ncbi:MAG: hypothetical protein AB7E72_16345 [Lysobacterales bacterium]
METRNPISISLETSLSANLARVAAEQGVSLDDAASLAISSELDRAMQSLLGPAAVPGDNVLLFSRRRP